jgi:hypothetical protein
VRRVKPSAILVGENWTETAGNAPYFGRGDGYGGSTELPLNFNFPLADAIRDGLLHQTAAPIVRVLLEMAARYPPFAMDAPFLTNHDQVRLADAVAPRRAADAQCGRHIADTSGNARACTTGKKWNREWTRALCELSDSPNTAYRLSADSELLFAGIMHPLHQDRCRDHEQAACADCENTIVVKQLVHHPAKE